MRAPGSQYQISEKGPKQRGRRDGDGRTEAKSLLLLRERTLCILKEEGETEMERRRWRERATVDAHLNATSATALPPSLLRQSGCSRHVIMGRTVNHLHSTFGKVEQQIGRVEQK